MLRWRFPDSSSRGWPAAAAALLWAVAAASIVLWWLHMPRAAAVPDAQVTLEQPSGPAQNRAGVERALGHTRAVATAPEMQNRFVLLGVIAASSGRGSALIAIDGQPPQAYIQGQSIEPGWTLKTVSPDAVTFQGPSGSMNLGLKN